MRLVVPRRKLLAFAFAVLASVPAGAAAAELAPWTGGQAPRLVLKDIAGKEHDLARYKGKVVLVNFWATWCGPCREEMPSLERLRKGLPDDAFAVLAVNVDEPEQRIRAFLEKMPLDLTVLVDPGMRATRDWSARILPASFVIDADGRIRYSVRGEVDWASEPVTRKVAGLIKRPG